MTPRAARWIAPALCLVLVAVLLPALAAPRPARAAALPDDFERTSIATGLDTPTAFRFAPDGRIIIAEKDGAVRLVKDGALRSAPMITLPVNGQDERGLLGLELDPQFAANGYIYLAYTHTDNLDRLSRFTVVGDSIPASSETILLRSDQQSNVFHHGGEVRFGPDGKLYWALGINLYNPNARNLGTIHGKMLRINSDGTIPPDNPFVNTAGAQPSIWAYGLRNPFRFTMVPDGPNAGKPLVGDVGGALYEEIDLIEKGADYGWPDAEGACTGCPYAQPVFAYPHTPPPASAGSVSGVAIYHGDAFPEEYHHAVFYADYTLGFIRYLKMDHEYKSVISDNVFDAAAGTTVQLEVGPDGNLYQLTIYPGVLSKIGPSGGNRSPVAEAAATPDNGLAPLQVNFSSAGSADPDGTPITYLWDFKDGTTSTAANPAHTFTTNGTHNVTLTVSDGSKSATATVPVTVGNRRPAGTITTPGSGFRYNAGDTISYGGTGTDPEDGTLPASAFSWSVIFHHADHVHPFLGPVNGVRSGTFTIPRIPDNVATTWYEIQLTVTDSGGLKHVSSVDIRPNLVDLTFRAEPPGTRFTIDGIPYTGTHTEQAVVGVERVLDAPSPQAVGSSQYTFSRWSDGGARSHTITTPAGGGTYQVDYTESTQPPAPWTSTDIGPRTIAGQTAYSNGTFTVTGGGPDIWGTDDEFRYVHRPLSGDGSIVARVTSQSRSDGWAKSGIMIKESATYRAKYAAVMVSPEHGMHFQFNFTGDTGEHAYTFPNAWMKLTRAGSLLTAFRSTDGTNWTEIGRTNLTMANDVTIGLFVNAHSDAVLNTTVFDNVSVTGGGGPGPDPGGGLPSPWARVDVGGATPTGTATYTAGTGTYTIEGGGTDLSGTQDQMSYVWQPLTGDGAITARLTSQERTDGRAKAGVIIRGSTTSGSPYGAMLAMPSRGAAFVHNGTSVSGGDATLPVWLRVVRTGTTVTGFRSANGTDWTQVGQATLSLPSQATVGMFVNARDGGESLGTATFDNVTVTGGGGGPGPDPSPWVSEDVGAPDLPGSSSESGGVHTVSGAGHDVWAEQDQFRYVHRSLTGDGTIIARVASQQNTDPWAKAGIMIKSSATAGAPYAAMLVTPGNGVHLQGTGPQGIAGPASGPWLKLVRRGDVFHGYSSADGSTWTFVGAITVPVAGQARAGLFVTSHNSTIMNTSTFDNVSVTPEQPATLPAGWDHGDIGSPALGGTAGASGRTFTLEGAGTDIWGTADQFHYAYRSLPGDGTIVTRVVSQENTDPWAKAGVMIKSTATAGSPYVALMTTPGNGIHVQSDFNSDTDGGPGTAPIWLRLTRTGTTITAYRSADGSVWTPVATRTLAGPATIGLFVNSHNSSRLSTVVFDGVTVS